MGIKPLERGLGCVAVIVVDNYDKDPSGTLCIRVARSLCEDTLLFSAELRLKKPTSAALCDDPRKEFRELHTMKPHVVAHP